MTEILETYLKRIKKIRVAKSKGIIAPHKPILLISIFQLFANKTIKENKVYLTAELVALFRDNWSRLATAQHDCRISYPFYYLRSDKFWHLKAKNSFFNIDSLGSLIKSFSKLNEVVEYGSFDTELFELLQQEVNCNIFISEILDYFFPETKSNFNKGGGELAVIEQKILNEDVVEYIAESKMLIREQREEEVFLRSSIFKREVPKIYNYTCCISGMKISSTENISMIDACHIVPFSESYNDTITNGIALCPNLHRAFDRGLIGVDNDYKVIVSDKFVENENDYSLKKFTGNRILLPSNYNYAPLIRNFQWHKENVFK